MQGSARGVLSYSFTSLALAGGFRMKEKKRGKSEELIKKKTWAEFAAEQTPEIRKFLYGYQTPKEVKE